MRQPAIHATAKAAGDGEIRRVLLECASAFTMGAALAFSLSLTLCFLDSLRFPYLVCCPRLRLPILHNVSGPFIHLGRDTEGMASQQGTKERLKSTNKLRANGATQLSLDLVEVTADLLAIIPLVPCWEQTAKACWRLPQ